MTNEELLRRLLQHAERRVPARPAHLRLTAEQLRTKLAARTPDEIRQLDEIAEAASDHPIRTGSEARVRVVIVEDQEIFRRGLCAQFERDARIEVVAEFGTAFEAVLAVPELRPSVTLMDLRLPWQPNETPRYCGAEAIRQIRQRWPEAAIAVITAFSDVEHVREAFKAGARGYVLKEATADKLLQTVHDTAAGAGVLSPTIADLLPSIIGGPSNGGVTFSKLTPRENEILKLFGEGKSIPEIARTLNIATKTVDNRLSDIPVKLGVTTRPEAAKLAREVGLSRRVEPENPGEAG